ncbi:MAG TPA: hypothetical protein IGS40_23380 [Trichormus sp. M33_DOE_039]|jgi:hypothetical protein|nr:hypothetical protein [Trichormus sp. M33_DOE_039]
MFLYIIEARLLTQKFWQFGNRSRKKVVLIDLSTGIADIARQKMQGSIVVCVFLDHRQLLIKG